MKTQRARVTVILLLTTLSFFIFGDRRPDSVELVPAGLNSLMKIRCAIGMETMPPPEASQPPAERLFTKGQRISRSVSVAAGKYNLPELLIHAVIKQESGFNSRARSPHGARGLMQLMPVTAREMGVRDSFDIGQNVDGGSRYLRQMLDRFGGDVKLALAAYNAGPSRVERCGGIPQNQETKRYVSKVLAHFEDFCGSLGLGSSASLSET